MDNFELAQVHYFINVLLLLILYGLMTFNIFKFESKILCVVEIQWSATADFSAIVFYVRYVL